MKKLVFFVILLIITTVNIYGQKLKDVLYLKNGGKVYGTLIEISDEQYKLKGSDGSIFVYPSAEVLRYAKEELVFDGRKKSGMTFALEAGVMIGGQINEYVAPFSFNALAGYTIEKRNLIGIGTGAEFLGQTFLPLFFEYKYNFRDKRVSPFLFARGGFLLHVGSDDDPENTNYYFPRDYEGGATLTIGTGLSWAGEDVEKYLSFAYRYAQTSYMQTEYNHQEVKYENNYNRLEVKFGFRF